MTAGAYLAVALGSALGGMGRYVVTMGVARTMGTAFPWGTLAVNITGALAVGLIAGLPGLQQTSTLWLFFIIGLCGSYTTVSSFSLQSFDLLRKGDRRGAVINVLGSAMACLLAVWLGLQLARWLWGSGA